MQNVVPAPPTTGAAALVPPALADRYEAYVEEVRRLLAAAFTVMERTGTLDPRVSDIVSESGLSNQAFYRHFSGKDALLLALLDDGRRQLTDYLDRRIAGAPPGVKQVRHWIEGVMEQARNPEAAARTRPFAINGTRLADRFPEETARSREVLLAPLRNAVSAAGGDGRRDADAIHHLTMGAMHDALIERITPSRQDVEHLVRFALAGLGASE